jgi:formiminoglutamase
MLELVEHTDISDLLTLRDFETKIGENIKTGSVSELAENGVKFVLLGVQESIGPRANFGNHGAENAWDSFLKSFINIQDNCFVNPLEIGILGSLKFNIDDDNIDALRTETNKIDKEVATIIEQIANHKMIPILIGGGHNNSFPLLLGTSQAYGISLNAINCDPHADFRPLEGRHSGNGFSYAMENGFLDKYFILGLHQNYNGKSIYKKFDEANKNREKVLWVYFDDWIYGNNNIENDLEIGIKFVQDKLVGLELDMDSIAYMPSSASSPSGIQLNEARMYISKCAINLNLAYLHLAEASPTNEIERKMVGKSLSYLVSDFIKNYKK